MYHRGSQVIFGVARQPSTAVARAEENSGSCTLTPIKFFNRRKPIRIRRASTTTRSRGPLLVGLRPNNVPLPSYPSVSSHYTSSLPPPAYQYPPDPKPDRDIITPNRGAQTRHLAHAIGIITSCLPAVLLAPLHYRGLQRLRNQLRLRHQDYNAHPALTPEAISDLYWWLSHLQSCNGRPLYFREPSLVLESDASKKGWGASVQGSKQLTAGGAWTPEEALVHINWLELKAALLAYSPLPGSRGTLTCSCFWTTE